VSCQIVSRCTRVLHPFYVGIFNDDKFKRSLRITTLEQTLIIIYRADWSRSDRVRALYIIRVNDPARLRVQFPPDEILRTRDRHTSHGIYYLQLFARALYRCVKTGTLYGRIVRVHR